LLLARLQSESPNHIFDLFRRASTWFEANGDPRLAVEFAIKAMDYEQAADLIERHITERWQTVDMEFFKLVHRLPFEVTAERPGLCLQSAWLSVLFGQTERILPLVDAAERVLERSVCLPAGRVDSNAAANSAFIRTLRAYVADLHNQPVVLDESLEMAYAAIPETNPGMRNSVGVVVGMICFMEGDFSSALRYYEDALTLDKRVNGTNAVPIATTRISFVLQAQGRLREAMRRLREAEDYVRERSIRRFYISGSLYQRMAEILLEWNNLVEAEARLLEGTRLLEDWPLPTTLGLGLALLVRLRIVRCDLAGARDALAQADLNARQTGLHPHFMDALERARLRLLLAEQDQPALKAWARENEPYRELPLSFRYEARQIELCRAWLALGRQADAVHLLERLRVAAQGRNGSRISVLLLLASARAFQPEKALIDLEEALRLAEPEGYLRTFLEAGEPLPQLLRFWLQRGPSSEDSRIRPYALSILSAFGHPLPGLSAAPAVVLPEPLSPREQEVLLLLARGLSNQQIADRLVISVRTVKKHVENIHGKLGAQNRTQAVVRAQELGLLP
jgi:LuxR family transcriptional regulator, maltose regulon positive regulatory protein